MSGHVRRRGKASWELKFDLGRDATGKRKIAYRSFKGTKRQAELELAKLIAAADLGTYVEPNRLAIGDFVRGRIDQWESAGDISARTSQRYHQLASGQIAPHLGNVPLQKLTTADIEAWHATLRSAGRRRGEGGIALRTIVHAHRVLSHALDDAARHGLTQRNPAKYQPPPKVPSAEVEILDSDGIARVIHEARGESIYGPAIVALFTGLRLGEILALRWPNIDLEAGVIAVRHTLEESKAKGLIFKAPKTRAGRRDVGLPDIVVETLRGHRRQQLEFRLQAGLGKMTDDAMVFPAADGRPQWPSAVSRAWGLVARDLGMAEITFHALRHSHASQLVDAGVDIVTISRRLGHASPDITLRVYAHLFRNDDRKAAIAINEALTGIARP